MRQALLEIRPRHDLLANLALRANYAGHLQIPPDLPCTPHPHSAAHMIRSAGCAAEGWLSFPRSTISAFSSGGYDPHYQSNTVGSTATQASCSLYESSAVPGTATQRCCHSTLLLGLILRLQSLRRPAVDAQDASRSAE